MIDWLFRNRRTGELTIAQRPNLPIALFTVATVVRWVTSPGGDAGRIVDGVATGSLLWWGVDELARGVNPFRRLLGAGALAVVVRGLLR